MARTCIFCGEDIPAFGGKKLTCGYDTEVVCPNCFDKYADMDEVELAQKILSTGRARDAQSLREYVKNQLEREQAAQERAARREEEFLSKHPETGKCPKCGGSMVQYGPLQIKLGEETLMFSNFSRLAAGSMTVRLERCRECGYTEFFTPEESELL